MERDGQLLFERAYGFANAELGVPNQTSTRFRLHSLTKPFTAAAVLRAVDQERLALSDSICERLAPCPESWRETSIRQLLNHTAGIPDFSGLLLSHFSGGTLETYRSIQDELADLEILENGAEFRYSNSGYVLLELILESVYDEPFSDILAAEVFVPSGMSSAGVQQPPPSGGYDGPPIVMHLASGYNGGPGARQEAMSRMYVIPGAGGLYATAADISAFARALFSGDLLSPTSRAEMLRLPPGSEKGYALGIVVVGRDEERSFRHDGGNNGYVSWLQHFPASRTTVVILSNYGFTPIRDLAADLVAAASSPSRASATEEDAR